jgi:hypothetical protein
VLVITGAVFSYFCQPDPSMATYAKYVIKEKEKKEKRKARLKAKALQ